MVWICLYEVLYLVTIITNENLIQEEIKCTFSLVKVCYHSVQNLLSRLLSKKKVKIRMYKTIKFPLALYGCGNWFLTLREINIYFFLILDCEAIGTAATPGLLCQPRVIVKVIVEKQMECRLTGETEVLGENQPQRHFCPSQNSTWPDPGLNPGRRSGKTLSVEYRLNLLVYS
jgi:hypothetical protein